MGEVAGRLVPLLGYGLMIGLLVLLSSDRRKIRWSILGWGAVLQLGLAAIMLLTPVGGRFFAGVNGLVLDLLAFTNEGTRFLLGEFGTGDIARPLHCFAFLVLPTIVFFSALMAVLYHLHVMEWVISGMAWVLRKTLRISAAEAMNAAANVFVGHTEAPLVIRPYLERLTPSELMAVMVSGFATMAGGVIVAYSVMLSPHLADVAGHLLAASLMNAPASLVVAKILFPETGVPETLDGARADRGERDANVVGAAARGAAEGAVLFINVAAMLLAFIALVALVNALVSGGLSLVGVERYGADGRPDALQWAGGWLFSPLAWLCGVQWDAAPEVGRLLAQKLILNEFVAYGDLSALLRGGPVLSARDATIAVYALCGFANISSIAIQVGGIGSLAPGQKGNLVRFGLKAMVGGFLASCLSACAAALFL
jgi:CNT family concentrative nucleoside transporter